MIMTKPSDRGLNSHTFSVQDCQYDFNTTPVQHWYDRSVWSALGTFSTNFSTTTDTIDTTALTMLTTTPTLLPICYHDLSDLMPPFHCATICSRSKPIWKSGPIGNKRELNGSDRKLIGNERQRSGMVGKVGGDLWTCTKIAPDLRWSGMGRRSSVRSVSWSSLIISWSYESGTQRVLSGCRISSRSYPL